MFKNKFRKVYVVCPAHNRTGGLELLHQLVFTLNKFGADASIAYTNINSSNPINEAYKKYVDSYVEFSKIKDSSENLVIISEHQVELMDNFSNAEVAIWWLSVDNYQKVYDYKVAYKLLGIKGVAWYIKNKRWKYKIKKINKKINYNFAQSYYAIDFLEKNNFKNIYFLSDYINSDYLNVKINGDEVRQNNVLYNPKKGLKFTNYLKKLDSTINWIPLINLTNSQVRDLLLISKVYIDFGNHPGKDRFPREAAICGCCVITGKKGSAGYFDDVPILPKYKFDDSKINAESIIEKIHYCLENYNESSEEFYEYRKMIANEEKKFNSDVKGIFID